MHDVRLAIRGLRATPIVSLAVVISLALAIGANTAIFSLVNGLLVRPLRVDDPHRLATISSSTALSHGFTTGLGWTYRMWERFQSLATEFDGAFAWSATTFNLADGGLVQ